MDMKVSGGMKNMSMCSDKNMGMGKKMMVKMPKKMKKMGKKMM